MNAATQCFGRAVATGGLVESRTCRCRHCCRGRSPLPTDPGPICVEFRFCCIALGQLSQRDSRSEGTPSIEQLFRPVSEAKLSVLFPHRTTVQMFWSKSLLRQCCLWVGGVPGQWGGGHRLAVQLGTGGGETTLDDKSDTNMTHATSRAVLNSALMGGCCHDANWPLLLPLQ